MSYEQPSILRYSSWSISSQEGTQQGDPLGYLLFCLVLQPILSSLTSELRIGYIDDITVGGTLTSVEHDVNFIRNNGPSVGLYLNATKCELITTTTPAQTSILSEFIVVKPSNMCLLGAPIFPETCLNEMLRHKLKEFERLSTNLRSIDAHDSLLIITFSLNTSRVMHLLRCSPCCGHPLLKELDNLQRSNICHIANVDLSDVQRIQASLPVNAGGFGIRRASSLASPVFLASYSSTDALQNIILMCTVGSIGSHYNQYAIDWSTTFSCSLPSKLESHKQCTWDKPMLQQTSITSSNHHKIHRAKLAFLPCLQHTVATGLTPCQLHLADSGLITKTFMWLSAFDLALHSVNLTYVHAALLLKKMAYMVCHASSAMANMRDAAL